MKGIFTKGYSETLCQLVEQVVRKTGRIEPGTVNLIGLLRAGPDLAELRRMLDMIHVKVNAVLTADSTLGDLEQLGRGSAQYRAVRAVRKGCGTTSADSLRYTIHHRGNPPRLPCINTVPGAGSRDPGYPIPIISPPGFSILIPDISSLKAPAYCHCQRPHPGISMTRFLADSGIVPRLVVVDFDSSVQEKITFLIHPAGEVLIEPGHELIMEKVKEHNIDLLIGGMLEQPIAQALAIEHVDIMHGSQKTIGFAGAHNLARLCCKRKRD